MSLNFSSTKPFCLGTVRAGRLIIELMLMGVLAHVSDHAPFFSARVGNGTFSKHFLIKVLAISGNT